MIRKIHKSEKGVAIMESMIAIIFMSLIFFGIMQLFHWAMAKMVCQYSSFYGSKAVSLGYAKRTIDKASRVAAMGISGKDYSTPKLNIKNMSKKAMLSKIQLYMSTGNAGVEFAYWDPNKSSMPALTSSLAFDNQDDMIVSRVTLKNSPMLTEGISGLLQINTDEANPSGQSRMYNHATNYLEE